MTEQRGTDHTVSVDGATVVRRRLPGQEGLSVTAEAELLAVVARHAPVPVPAVLRTWPDRQEMEMERVRGVPLLELLAARRPVVQERLEEWARSLGGLHAALGRIPEAEVAGLVPRDPTTPEEYLAELRPLADELRGDLPSGARAGVDRFLSQPAPPAAAALRLCHGDLGAEHVFVDPDTGRITGVIDWSDAAVGDPALDAGLALRDLGPSAYRCFVDELTGPDPGFHARASCYARARALEDLAFGIEHDHDGYRRNALRAIEVLFGPDGA